MNRMNYQKWLDNELVKIRESSLDGKPKRLFIHSCCAPCSSYVLEYLSQYFVITLFYYNPNISPKEEYEERVEEQKRLITQMPFRYPVTFLEGSYEPGLFYRLVKGLEEEPEGGSRCPVCYEMRLRLAARLASEGDYDYFTTTLSISPLKPADKLNEIGERLSKEYGIPYLFSDFKKKNGYKRSVELSGEYGLYRQNYCGCIFSKQEAEKRNGS